MSIQLSVAVRNARLDAIESTAGTTAILKIFDLSAAAPANCAAADVGGTLVTMTLPADWAAAASGGSKALSGTWQDASADAAGTADFFRLYANDGTTCHLQGSVGVGLDMTLDNYVIAASQTVTITSFTLTDGNA